jgi:rubrerythrin
MKRLLFIALITFFALGATKPLPPEVRRVLDDAIAGEREAIAKYDAYAAKAVEEGYLGAAALFRAAGQAERVHLRRFEAAAKTHGVPVAEEKPFVPAVGSTEDNLRRAGEAEIGERDGIYRDAVQAAKDSGVTDIARMFDQTRDTETEHANLCLAAVRNLNGMKQAKSYHVCDACGYTTDIDLRRCPSCTRSDMVSVD